MLTPGDTFGPGLVVESMGPLPDGRWVGTARNPAGALLRVLVTRLAAAPVVPLPAALDAAVQRWQRQTHGLRELLPLVGAGLIGEAAAPGGAPRLWLAWESGGAPALPAAPAAPTLGRDVRRALDALHAYGLVHGALLAALIELDARGPRLGGHGAAAIVAALAPAAPEARRREADDVAELDALLASLTPAAPPLAAADAPLAAEGTPLAAEGAPLAAEGAPLVAADAPRAAEAAPRAAEAAAPPGSAPGAPGAGPSTAPRGRAGAAPRVFAAERAGTAPGPPPAPAGNTGARPEATEPRAWLPWLLGGLALLLMAGGVALAFALTGGARAGALAGGSAGGAPAGGGGGPGGQAAAAGGAPGAAGAPGAGGAPAGIPSPGAGGAPQGSAAPDAGQAPASPPGEGGPPDDHADGADGGGPFADGPPPVGPAVPEVGVAPPLVTGFDVRVGRRVGSRDDERAALPIDAEVPLLGPELGPVTLLVFGDLHCPHTRRMLRDLARLRAREGRDLRIAWRHRPLAANTGSREAALIASAVARAEGDLAFFRVLDAAARSPASAAPLDWLRTAGVTGVDAARAAKDAAALARLEADLELAGRFDVRATPTVFLNGHRVEGAVGVEVLRQLVVAERTLAARTHQAVPESVYRLRVDANLIGLGTR